MSWPGCICFWTEPNGQGQRWLWVSEDGDCSSPWKSHSARVRLADGPLVPGSHGGYMGNFDPTPEEAKGYQVKCDFCAHVFTDAARRKGNVDRIYLDQAGTQFVLRGPVGEGGRATPGMLFDMDWFEHREPRYPDGINLAAVTPDGTIWNVDGPAYGAGGQTPNAWSRTGDPRDPVGSGLSATPSIDCGAGNYHGYLTAGRFTDGL